MKLRLVLADDERPARSYLTSLLHGLDDVEIVGEAASGQEAITLIEATTPHVALLDIRMPDIDGFEVVRVLRKDRAPSVVFVTAHDEYAVRAFELNAVDYLLKPVRRDRLLGALDRVRGRRANADLRTEDAARVQAAASQYAADAGPYLERIPVRRRDAITIVPVPRIASVVSDGELLHLTTVQNERHLISYTFRELETRLDPANFVRLSRGTLVAIEQIDTVRLVPGGTQLVTLHNGQELPVSRTQARILRAQLLKL